MREIAKLAAVAAFVSGLSAAPLSAFEGPAQAVDGDSIVVGGRELRLGGIDAPEWKQVCRRAAADWRAGRDATAALRSLLAGRTVACSDSGERTYGRPVVVCWIDGEELNARLVRDGWAFDYAKYSKGRYAAAEAEAREARRGVWSGECEPPWDWRRANR